MKKRRFSSAQIWTVLLLLAACVIGVSAFREAETAGAPRALFNDATPLGGKGFRRVLERLGYSVKRAANRLEAMPADAKVWLIFDPQTQFSRPEAEKLLAWVKKGGTLIWASPPENFGFSTAPINQSAGLDELRAEIQVRSGGIPNWGNGGVSLPALTPLNLDAVSLYRTGVSRATASAGTLEISRTFVEIAGSPVAAQIARIDYGKGRVFVLPDAILFCNYGLSKPDNAVLATNLIRVHESSGAVYFDERQHGELATDPDFVPSLLYYLWRPPLRWMWIQLAITGLLFWILVGRRFGTPVPLPDGGPVTRASQFAAAMGALFRKVERPHAAALILGAEFRRRLAKRIGMSPADPDIALAKRAHELSGVSEAVVDRLLLHGKSPSNNESEALRDARDMEEILRKLEGR